MTTVTEILQALQSKTRKPGSPVMAAFKEKPEKLLVSWNRSQPWVVCEVALGGGRTLLAGC